MSIELCVNDIVSITKDSVCIDKSSYPKYCTYCLKGSCICQLIHTNKYLIPILNVSFKEQICFLKKIPAPLVGDEFPLSSLRRDIIISRAYRDHYTELKRTQLSTWITTLIKTGFMFATAMDGSSPKPGQKTKVGLTVNGLHYCIRYFVEGELVTYRKK